MAQPLKSVGLAAPGFAGLNLQDSPVGEASVYALVADNCVIDQQGRLAARKGWTAVNAVNTTLGTNNINTLHEYINAAGTSTYISIGNKNVFTGTSTLTSIYSDNTWTGTNWKVVNFNNKCYFFQRAHDPLVYDGSTLVKISAASGYAGTVQQANEVLAAYGRLWTADTTSDKQTIKWSDTLLGHVWTGGASGSLDLHNVFTNGTDEVVALAAHNNFLFILCKRQVIIYQGANTPSTMTLYDTINNVGCIARDSVRDIGDDIIFLSDTGLVSCGRLIQERSAPIYNLSRSVQDQLVAELGNESDLGALRSVYSPQDKFYLLSMPTNDKVYVFDTRSKLEDGSFRVTNWVSQTPTAFLATRDRQLYMGKAGYIGKYTGYLDNGSVYQMRFYTTYFDGGQDRPFLKVLKRLLMTIIGGGGSTITMKWTVDFSGQVAGSGTNASLPVPAQYNISEFNIGEYGNQNVATKLRQVLSGTGQVFQIGMEAIINNSALSIQQYDVFYKLGREA